MPAVSIVIPTYNRASVVGRAIDSALAQTADDLEVIVVDDGSTDGTDAVLDSCDDDRLEVLETGSNGGANAARNRGIERATGEFVSFLDSDDELASTHVARVLETFQEAPEQVRGVYTSYRKHRDGAVYDVIRAQERVTLEDLGRGNPVGSFSATTFRASAFDDVGPLDEELPAVQDYEFYLRLLAADEGAEIRGIPELLLDRHTDGERIGTDPERKLEGYRRVLERHGEHVGRRRRAELAANVAIIYAESGRRESAAAYLRHALAIDPGNVRYTLYYWAASVGCRALLGVLEVKSRLAVFASRLESYRSGS
ncbi:glycosyl transferase family protein [Natronococcus amylolyticus DSM 10524]|uniref:Glycosyl transferase family protein n=1 Tax=Natronococcus amylolyticus DSM 10524 TaxID=1227497 RepID=L9WVM6_9EURY|nr:glycosyltransferase [Natronococcus amylolyticus]ELY53472.1 glycosyl transferase family protein [Natronococcus amylolyticus DSM 10524]